MEVSLGEIKRTCVSGVGVWGRLGRLGEGPSRELRHRRLGAWVGLRSDGRDALTHAGKVRGTVVA